MKSPEKNDPAMWRLLGVPAMVAYRDAYRIAQRIERGCAMSIRGFRDAVYDAEFGGGTDD